MEINQQVVYFEDRRGVKVVRTGTILGFKENNNIAIVSPQSDLRQGLTIAASRQLEIPITSLKAASGHFHGRAAVHANPLKRGAIIQQFSSAYGNLSQTLR